MADPQDLTRRVLDAVPAGSYAMQALLSLARIDVSSDVPTAAVTCERRPALLINPDFVAAHCRTDEHLFMLVMHELYHVLLGHTRLYPVMTPAHNVAFDAVINAMLVARFPAMAYTSFFTELYAKETGVLRLLAPPGESPAEEPALAALHDALYGHREVTAREVFDRITRDATCQAGDISRLLGSHGRPGEPESPIDTAFAEAVESIAGNWPAEPGTRGLGGALAKRRVAAETPGQRVLAAVRRALLGAASLPGGPRRTHASLLVATPVPDLRDRRASVSRALGRWPLLNAGSISVRRPAFGRAEVYFDVSGSVNTLLPHLCGALRELRAHIAPDIHQFSTVVHTASLDQLIAGDVRTTGGNNPTCVLEHIIELRPRKALLITDGLVGQAPEELVRRALGACRDIRVLLTAGGSSRDLAPIASRIDQMPSLFV